MSELYGIECGRSRRTLGWRESLSRCRGIRQPNVLPSVNGQQGKSRLSQGADPRLRTRRRKLQVSPDPFCALLPTPVSFLLFPPLSHSLLFSAVLSSPLSFSLHTSLGVLFNPATGLGSAVSSGVARILLGGGHGRVAHGFRSSW